MEMEMCMETTYQSPECGGCEQGAEIVEPEIVEAKKRTAPIRMTIDDATNVVRELRRYPKKRSESFVSKKEVLEMLAPGITELHQKKGYSAREIVGILKEFRAYNYTTKEIAALVESGPITESQCTMDRSDACTEEHYT